MAMLDLERHFIVLLTVFHSLTDLRYDLLLINTIDRLWWRYRCMSLISCKSCLPEAINLFQVPKLALLAELCTTANPRRQSVPGTMDPLSITASSVGFLSLAIELADRVDRICRFIDKVEQAPKELSRLIGLLGQLHCLLNGISHVLQRLQLRDDAGDLSATIWVALQACDVQVKALADVISDTGPRRESSEAHMVIHSSGIEEKRHRGYRECPPPGHDHPAHGHDP